MIITKDRQHTMKAIILTQYGPPDVLQLQEVPKPTPREKEILVRVAATSVGFGDLMARNFKAVTPRDFNMPWPLWLISKFYFGPSSPKVRILGSEFSGVVESIGSAVTSFKPGDPVFGFLGQAMGAYAEYICLPENGVVAHKPANLSFEQAAVLPYGAIMALNLLQKGGLRQGEKILVLGASGSIGSAAVQLASRHFGAEVTGVCGAPGLEYVKALGARQVIDYTRQDFTQNGETYDLIFDILGRSSFPKIKNSLAPGGRCLYASFKSQQLGQMLRTSLSGSQKVICAIAPGSRADLLAVKDLAEAGELAPIVQRSFPLEQTAEAHRAVEQGHKQGAVAITVGAKHLSPIPE